MNGLMTLATSPDIWIALLTLVVMEVVLGVDNLVFISIISNKVPQQSRDQVRRLGIGLALVLRLALLSGIAFIVRLTKPVVTLPFLAPSPAGGHPPVDLSFSWRDLILIAGGLFLVWKATTEIHHSIDPTPGHGMFDKRDAPSWAPVRRLLRFLPWTSSSPSTPS